MPYEEVESILTHCHSRECGGHFGGNKTIAKVLQAGFFWPTVVKDGHDFFVECDHCPRLGSISRRNEKPLNSILEVEVFDVVGIHFMRLFPLHSTTNIVFWPWIMCPGG